MRLNARLSPRRNNRWWWGLVSLALMVSACATPTPTAPQPIPVPAHLVIHRPLWFGFFEFTIDPTLPHNMRLFVNRSLTDVWLPFEGPRWVYTAGTPDGDWASLHDNIARSATMTNMPVVAYVPSRLQVLLPSSAHIQGIEAYWNIAETEDQFYTRISTAATRSPRAILIVQCYTSNASHITDLTRIPPVIVRLVNAHPTIEGLLLFSGVGRATGWIDHPEVHTQWWEVFRGIPGAPK